MLVMAMVTPLGDVRGGHEEQSLVRSSEMHVLTYMRGCVRLTLYCLFWLFFVQRFMSLYV